MLVWFWFFLMEGVPLKVKGISGYEENINLMNHTSYFNHILSL